jgi:CBS domain containing-hemolysin-like protein
MSLSARCSSILRKIKKSWSTNNKGISVSDIPVIAHSVEELKLLIEDTEEAGILEAEQATFLQNVFQLSSKTVSDCMIPREKMGMIELSLPFEQVMELIRDGGHTRMPVFDKEIDNVVGIVNTKDLFYLISAKGVVVLEDALYPVIFMKPESTIAHALKIFKNSHRHMAVVRDEVSQQVLGLITFEDILEEIVGPIEDEHDFATKNISIARVNGQPQIEMLDISSNYTFNIKTHVSVSHA